MRCNFSYLIKISIILVLLLQAGRVSGQTKIQFTYGSSTTFANGTISIPNSRFNSNVDYNCPQLDNSYPWLDEGHFAQVNFSNPVANVVIEFLGAQDETLSLQVNGVFYPITLAMLSCGWITCSSFPECGDPIITNGTVVKPGGNAYRLTIAPTTVITSFRITCSVSASGFGVSNFTYKNCAVGTTAAPTLSANTRTNVCPEGTINLDSLVTSTLPSGAALRWFSNNTATGTALTNTSAVTTAGTYYAYYYDPSNICYTPATAAVTATLTDCCPSTSPIVN